MANPNSAIWWKLETVHPSDPASQLDVPWEDGDPISMDGAQVGVREHEHKERLGSLVRKRH